MNMALRNIFVRVVRRRVENEGRPAGDILLLYPKLTEEERAEILAEI